MRHNVPKIDIKEFRERGYLQEVNRCFLHPLGLALEVEIDEDGNETLGGIWDYRDDPEGVYYADGVIDPKKVSNVEADLMAKRDVRANKLGVIQRVI